MAKVRSQCSRCGTVEVPCPTVTVIRQRWQAGAEYNFACPICTEAVRGSLRPDTALQLVAEGARLLEVECTTVSPITLDEVEAFTAKLDTPGALERELGSLR
ncbi:MAG TPA: hypothetical protein VGR90_10340 [Acidimicrobiales bacterium]|nr:hypothetical protein [Acidimicrobiales bacterium]